MGTKVRDVISRLQKTTCKKEIFAINEELAKGLLSDETYMKDFPNSTYEDALLASAYGIRELCLIGALEGWMSVGNAERIHDSFTDYNKVIKSSQQIN